MKNLAVLILRLTLGILMAGHGAQKLFGWFKGPGLQGTGGMMESLGMQPAKFWGTTAALGEFTGGSLTALGFLHPLGPQNIAASMSVAIRRVHWRLPIWASERGAELPLTNLSVAAALMLLGPGDYSLDRILGVKPPRWMVVLSYLWVAAVTAAALFRPALVQETFERVMEQVPGQTGSPESGPEVEVETRPRQREVTATPS